MKNFYIAVAKTNKNRTKFYAYTEKATPSNNLLNYFSDTTEYANICESKKEADALVDFWNECYKNNGTFAIILN